MEMCENTKIVYNRKCPRCDNFLYQSDIDGYEYVCYECDENFYECEAIDCYDYIY